MISYCLLKGRQEIQSAEGTHPRSELASEQPAQLQSQAWSFACPGTHPPRQESQGEIQALVVHLSLSVKPTQAKAQRWSERTCVQCQSRVSIQMLFFFFFFLRTWNLQKLGSLQVKKNTELALRSVHLLLSWLPFLLLVQQTYWTESALGPVPALKFSSSCEHTLTDAGKKVKLF